jgi:nicotinate phosphoribosyltransferase
MPEAQFVESRSINLLHYQTMVGSEGGPLRAGRGGPVAGGLRPAPRPWRRCRHALRTSELAGGLSLAPATTEAARVFGIPINGTMAHSYVQAHGDETRGVRALRALAAGQLRC